MLKQNNFEKITWWDDLDFIGIDAYFPFCEDIDPTVDQLTDSYQPIADSLSLFAAKWNKKIIYTEYGFLSVDGAAGKHWELDTSIENINLDLQARSYKAILEVLQRSDWYSGGFFWKWHFQVRNKMRLKTRWTPQGKPAMDVIKDYYGNPDFFKKENLKER